MAKNRSLKELEQIRVACGWLSQIQLKLVLFMDELGATAEDFQALTTDEGVETIWEMARVGVQRTKGVWKALFGHLRVWNGNFNASNFPLEPESEAIPVEDIEEYGFDEMVKGHEAVRRLQEMGFVFPGPRACGKYIKAKPTAQREHPLLGPRWRRPGRGDEGVSVFGWHDGGPDVRLDWLDDGFLPGCRWLVARKKEEA